MGNKILNLLAKIFPGLKKLGHEDWQPEDDEEPVRHGLTIVSSIRAETPEGMYYENRLTDWGRGQYGDIELFPNYEELLIRRAFNEHLERQIIGG